VSKAQADDANARYLPQASRRVIEPCEMSEDASAPSGWAPERRRRGSPIWASKAITVAPASWTVLYWSASMALKARNDGKDTCALQHYLGHKNIMHTVRYTEL
jgi:hypothetical protein